jgi:hypothetical protein
MRFMTARGLEPIRLARTSRVRLIRERWADPASFVELMMEG